MASPTGGITRAVVASLEGGHRSMASALEFADRQFPERAELQLSNQQHFPREALLTFRGSSTSRRGEWIEKSMLLSDSLRLPKGAGAAAQVGQLQLGLDHTG